jgi:hypothetical protein
MRIEKILSGLLIIAAVSSVGCGKSTAPEAAKSEQQSPSPASNLASVVRMNDPSASAQLVSGFWGLENNAWRWTARKFSVQLPTPAEGATKGGTLTMSFTLPDSEIHELKDITLSAAIGGAELKSEKYTAGGSYTFTADVPAGSLLSAKTVQVDFSLDKSSRPPGDKRDLGVIAGTVALAGK